MQREVWRVARETAPPGDINFARTLTPSDYKHAVSLEFASWIKFYLSVNSLDVRFEIANEKSNGVGLLSGYLSWSSWRKQIINN